MNIVLTDTTNLQGLYEHVKFITGQTNLSFEDFVRLTNFAMDDYSSIVMSADGRWKWDDSTNTTEPQGYTQVTSGKRSYTLDTNYLSINRVEIKVNSVWHVVEPIDQRDYKNQSLENQYGTSGVPRYYDYDGQQIKLYPAPDWSDSGDASVIANNSLHVDFTRPAVYFDVADSNATVGIPRIHHRYIALKVIHQVMMANNDPSIASVERELVSWEGIERQGMLSGGKIREYFTTRDENTPRQMKPKQYHVFNKRK